MKKGSHQSEETKKKISKARKKLFSEGKLKNNFQGKNHSEESKEKMRLAWIEKKKKGQKPWNKGLSSDKKSPSYDPRLTISGQTQTNTKSKMDIVTWNTGLTKDTDTRIKQHGIRHKEWWANPLYVDAHNRVLESTKRHPCKNTDIEIIIHKILSNNNIPFRTEVPILGITRVDVFIPPNICIYADGNYWHNYPYGLEKDRIQTTKLQSKGYIVLRFWGSELKKKPEKCLNRILKVV